MQQNPSKINKMEKEIKKKKKFRFTPTPKKKFLAVDVWQSKFSETSEKAVFEIYARKFKVPHYKVKYLNFSTCVNKLRSLEDLEYVAST